MGFNVGLLKGIPVVLLIGGTLFLFAPDSGVTDVLSTFAGGDDDLALCPDLSRGQRDPVDGMDCVDPLQRGLRAEGADGLTVDGVFGDSTLAAVKSFQRKHGLPADGRVGPLTRSALLGGPARMGMGSGSRLDCESGRCDLYLSRSSTSKLAKRLADHPVATSAASHGLFALLCGRLRLAAGAACDISANVAFDKFSNQLQAAAQRGLCLHLYVSATPPAAKAVPEASRHCP